jgi:hypothetical protein
MSSLESLSLLPKQPIAEQRLCSYLENTVLNAEHRLHLQDVVSPGVPDGDHASAQFVARSSRVRRKNRSALLNQLHKQ